MTEQGRQSQRRQTVIKQSRFQLGVHHNLPLHPHSHCQPAYQTYSTTDSQHTNTNPTPLLSVKAAIRSYVPKLAANYLKGMQKPCKHHQQPSDRSLPTHLLMYFGSIAGNVML